jgi:glycosyltransferase involved in cell wall biosynthesis
MVTPGYYPIKGGTETIVRNLSILLNKKGVQTDVMTFSMNRKWNAKWRGKTEIIDGITVFRIPALNWLPIAHSDRITLGINLIPSRFKYILKNYDIVHFHEFELSFPLFSCTVRKPKIIHFHGINIDFLKRYHLSRLLLKHLADFYISITKKMRNDLLKLGLPTNKVIYVPNGINTSLFVPKGEKEDNLILFVGRITAAKGLHILLKALSYLRTSVHLAVIGPSDWDQKYYVDVLRLIEKENQRGTHRITYLGALDQVDVITWYQKASIFVLPSFAEGFPVTVLEALSCELPVIVTPVGGIPEVVKDKENGILVPVNDAVRLSEAIQFLLDNKDARIRFGRKGRKSVIENFSIETMASRLRELYEKIIRKGSP